MQSSQQSRAQAQHFLAQMAHSMPNQRLPNKKEAFRESFMDFKQLNSHLELPRCARGPANFIYFAKNCGFVYVGRNGSCQWKYGEFFHSQSSLSTVPTRNVAPQSDGSNPTSDQSQQQQQQQQPTPPETFRVPIIKLHDKCKDLNVSTLFAPASEKAILAIDVSLLPRYLVLGSCGDTSMAADLGARAKSTLHLLDLSDIILQETPDDEQNQEETFVSSAARAFSTSLVEALCANQRMVVMHNPRRGLAVLRMVFNDSFEKLTAHAMFFDVQLAQELICGKFNAPLRDVLSQAGVLAIGEALDYLTKHSINEELPRESPHRRHFVRKTQLLLEEAFPFFQNKLAELMDGRELTSQIIGSSRERAKFAIEFDGHVQVSFDMSDNDCQLASDEIMRLRKMEQRKVLEEKKMTLDLSPIIALFERDPIANEEDEDDVLCSCIRDYINYVNRGHSGTAQHPEEFYTLNDIVLDIGRRPCFFLDNKRQYFSENEDMKVDANLLQRVKDQVGDFGSDNRAGFESQLHRVSCMRNRADQIVGYTIRVGRHIQAASSMLTDILLGKEFRDKSILILGNPGSGKTTIIRSITDILSRKTNVIVVDTSNEIAGDGDVPGACIGEARRMMVPCLEDQGRVMVECLQNHTPKVMVIDEIGRSQEVDAAKTTKLRGVRMIASAHGDLRGLMKNSQLNGLIGGIESILLSDAAVTTSNATRAVRGKKICREALHLEIDVPHTTGATEAINPRDKSSPIRKALPTFDVIIEVTPEKRDSWRVIKDVKAAVDGILDGTGYIAERRDSYGQFIQLSHEFI